VLALSSFMSWYTFDADVGFTVSITGWHTGLLGKLVFFVGVAVLRHRFSLFIASTPSVETAASDLRCHSGKQSQLHRKSALKDLFTGSRGVDCRKHGHIGT